MICRLWPRRVNAFPRQQRWLSLGTVRSLFRRRPIRIAAALAGILLAGTQLIPAGAAQPMPRLVQQHGASQIFVDGKPFLVRGGELENSSASSLAYLDTIWPKVVAMRFNTVLAPVYWQLIEPRQGDFDFTTVDGLIRGARKHNVKLVLLWFGSWPSSVPA